MTETLHPYQQPYDPPPYPYDLLDEVRTVAAERFGSTIDCSIGAPVDPPPAAVIEALSTSNAERGYPPSIGTLAYREAAVRWMARITGVAIDPATQIGAAVGTIIGQIAGLVAGMWALYSGRFALSLLPATSYRPDRELASRILTIGIPAGLQGIFRNGSNILFVKFLALTQNPVAAVAAYTHAGGVLTAITERRRAAGADPPVAAVMGAVLFLQALGQFLH